MVQQANILPLRPLGQTQHQAEGLQEWLLLFFFSCMCMCGFSKCVLWVTLCVSELLHLGSPLLADHHPDNSQVFDCYTLYV